MRLWLDIILMCWEKKTQVYILFFCFFSCSFVLTQKNQKVKAYYKFHTDVRLGKARKTKPVRVSHIRAAREAGVLLRTCPRCLPSSTSVVKFLLGRSLYPENNPEKPNPCSAMLL